MTNWQIPVIDLGAYRSGNPQAKSRTAAEIDRWCRQVGFLVIENHGIPRALLDRVFALGREFFDFPEAEKRRYQPRDKVVPRGYLAMAMRNLAKTLGHDSPPDLREQFLIGPLHAELERYAHVEGAGRSDPPTSASCSASSTRRWRSSRCT